MEFDKKIPSIPINERVAMNGQKMGRSAGMNAGGPKMNVPEGESLIDLIRSGMRLEDAGKTPEEAAFAIGVGSKSYREARSIIRLSEWDALNRNELSLVFRAIDIMVKERRSTKAFELVRDLSKRVWGAGTNPRNEKTAMKIVDDFMNAVSVITVACDKGAQLTVPQLNAADAIEVILQLKEAMKALKQLRSNLSRRI
jgi:hypothetical protein